MDKLVDSAFLLLCHVLVSAAAVDAFGLLRGLGVYAAVYLLMPYRVRP